MVTQRPLEALFLVRVQAGQPTKILSNRRTVSEIGWNRSHFHSRVETHENAPNRNLFVKGFRRYRWIFARFRMLTDLEQLTVGGDLQEVWARK
jgi:hypothetical protein